MKIKKTPLCFIFLFSLVISQAFCFESVPATQLLLSYLENDTDLQNNALNAKKAQLSLDSTKIDNGFDITLSTGTITINSNQEGTGFTVKPVVKASVPQAQNLTVTASSSVEIRTSSQSATDNKLSLSLDLIGPNAINREVELLKAERTLTEAERKLRNQAITSEKEFYTELKSLLTSVKSLITTTQSYYTNQIDFEKIKAQGYSERSSTYRLAQMKVLSGEHEIENMNRSIVHSFVLFYKKCGMDITIDENTPYYELIPTDICEPEILDIKTFSPDSYTETEAALWTNKINSLQRKASSNFSLSANTGFTFNNSSTSSHTVDAGLSTTIGGATLNAGVSVPIASGSTPAVTLSASLSPNTFRQNEITKQKELIDEEQELLAIKIARTNYENKIVEMEQNLLDIQWTIQDDNQSFEMYDQLEKELLSWYKQGIVTQSEYSSAKTNARSYAVKKLMNILDLIIYNDTVQTMFVTEN